MTNPYELFATNQDLEAGKGVTLEYPGFEIIIHRAGGANKKFAKVLAEKFKPHRKKHEQNILDEDIANQILVEAYAESVIVGWNKVKDKEGKDMPFSVENCIKLLLDLPELFKDIQEQANSFATFKADIEAIEEKN